jgi:2,3-dihydroxybenzoate-AMP ligase
MTPSRLAFFWAQMNPEQSAIIQSDMALTYGDLKQAVDAIGERIERYDLAKSDPVAVAIPHPARQLMVCLALMRCGISVAPISQGALFYVRQAGINTVIHAGQGLMTAGGRNIQYEDSWLRRDDKLSGAATRVGPRIASNSDLMFVTLGAAGAVKKLIVSQRAIADRVKGLPVTGETNFERTLIVPDLTSPSGFLPALMQLCAGRTACFAPDHDAQLLLIETFEIEAISAPSQEIQGLLETVEKRRAYQCDSLKEIRVGPSSPELVRRVQSRRCRNVTLDYGGPEAGLIASGNYDVIAGVPNAVGFVMPGVSVEIIDEAGVRLPIGTTGVVRARSAYSANVSAASNADKGSGLDQAWWYPGDRGHLTENGILCIEARAGR